MVQKIRWTSRAFKDLRGIYEFIAKDSTRYAQTQIESIQDSVSNLVEFPLMGYKITEFPHSPYREILVSNYRVIYKYDKEKNQIFVMAVLHGRMLIRKNI